MLLTACNTSTQSTQTIEPSRLPSGMTVVPSSAIATDIEPTGTATSMLPTPLVCNSSPPSRMVILERGQVTYNNERLNLRSGPGTDYNAITLMEPGDVFIVLDGPACQEGYQWYRVRFDDVFGWIAEGDDDEYYVQPYPLG